MSTFLRSSRCISRSKTGRLLINRTQVGSSLAQCHKSIQSRSNTTDSAQSILQEEDTGREAQDGGHQLRLNAEDSQNDDSHVRQVSSNSDEWHKPKFWTEFEKSYEQKPRKATSLPHFQFPLDWYDIKKLVVGQGQLLKVKPLSKDLVFANVRTAHGSEVQLLCQKNHAIAELLKEMAIGSAVRFTGRIQRKLQPKKKDDVPSNVSANGKQVGFSIRPVHKVSPLSNLDDAEVVVSELSCINTFQSISTGNPTDPTVAHPPESRHLQIRFDKGLADRLRLRSKVVKIIREHLKGFQEVETPILFKSTPEGAREFLVPTRKKGFAYALPQSPQQYKQILIASGIDKYFQFARCFRDEDMRADRQPEFTQVDLEMAWADGTTVMATVERLVKSIYHQVPGLAGKVVYPSKVDSNFPIFTYEQAMRKHGSDKPDLRISGEISNIGRSGANIVSDQLKKMISPIDRPKINGWRFRMGIPPKQAKNFVSKFLDSPEASVFHQNPDGGPGVAVFDSRAPLEGLQMFGHEGAAALQTHMSRHGGYLEDGDVYIIQARQGPLQGGSTMLGRLRIAMYKAAVEQGLVEEVKDHHYLWVTKFPMFTPNDGIDPGQGGSSGFSATHHPFTAPYSMEDIELLRTDPLLAQADHYDLVVNGVELGGGSRRIHNVDMQKYVMRDILKMSEERMKDFSHLFEALAAGCPPHAGFAIGFDRMMAVLTGRESVRDVIAFPKSSKGEDLMVKSPSMVTGDNLATYHLALKKDTAAVGEGSPVVESLGKDLKGATPSSA